MFLSHRPLLVALVLTLTRGRSAAVWSADAARPEHVRAVAAAPFAGTLMPYNGYGYVGVLNNGLVVIEPGGELVYDPATDEYVPSPIGAHYNSPGQRPGIDGPTQREP